MVQEDGTPIALVHWTYQDGHWRVACAPHVHPDGNWQRTNDARAVSCPMCKLTDGFKEALAREPAIPRAS
jgi:hypothetical protein